MATIKKIILLALTALMVVGCGDNDSINKSPSRSGDILTIDSCQYVICWYGGYKGFLAHKGNCSFCKERRQKELEELVIKLKEK